MGWGPVAPYLSPTFLVLESLWQEGQFCSYEMSISVVVSVMWSSAFPWHLGDHSRCLGQWLEASGDNGMSLYLILVFLFLREMICKFWAKQPHFGNF